MKKIDKLILSSFIGPFILTFLVVVFILLTQHMLKYFDDIIGKDLGWGVLGTLLFYFAIFMVPVAMPLAVLLSSLITFGNLGEHFELTAVKSLGISLVRSLAPIFCFVLLLTALAFWANNNLVPKAALEAYSLMYDIKQKKPALDLREGAFYNSIPDISIKVNDVFPDQKTLKGVIIYDHRGHAGNKEVIMADSGKMYTILNNQYLKFELFKGFRYTEGSGTDRDMAGRPVHAENSSRTKFSGMQVVFDLSSFALLRTDKKWFQGNRIMRNMVELSSDMDSVKREMNLQKIDVYSNKDRLFRYHFADDTLTLSSSLLKLKHEKDSIDLARNQATHSTEKTAVVKPSGNVDTTKLSVAQKKPLQQKNDSVVRLIKPVVKAPEKTAHLVKPGLKPGKLMVVKEGAPQSKRVARPLTKKAKAMSDSIFKTPETSIQLDAAISYVRLMKSQFLNSRTNLEEQDFRFKEFQIQWHKILSNSLACIVMFLIGAPLGAIIKKGGLGVPVLTSILFFIIFYLMSMTGEKWAKAGTVSVPIGIWASDFILFIVGMLFLRQARVDARLFDADFYLVVWDKIKTQLQKRKIIKSVPA